MVGLVGKDKPYCNFKDFLSSLRAKKVSDEAALESVAAELSRNGRLMSRMLSYAGVKHTTLTVPLGKNEKMMEEAVALRCRGRGRSRLA